MSSQRESALTSLVALIVGLDVVLLLFWSIREHMLSIHFNHFHIQSIPFAYILALLEETLD